MSIIIDLYRNAALGNRMDGAHPLGDGSVGGGGSVTLTGTGFGTLNLSNTFSSTEALSSLSNGQEVPSSGLSGFSSATSGVRLAVAMEDGAKNRGSNLSILCENDGDSNGPANSTLVFDYGSGIGQSTKIFWSSWDRFTAKAPDTIGDGQWKLRRLGATNNISDNNAELVLFRNNYSGNNAVNYSIRTSTATVNHFDQSGTVNDLNKPQFDDTWRRTDQFIDTGTDGAYNGSIQIVGHFPDFSAIPALYSMEEFDATAVWPDAENVYGSGSERFRYFLHQNFFGNGAGTYPMSSYGAEVRHNDIFIQIGSYKRVELCNSTSLATATHREILYPTAWSDTSVTAKVRQGGFSSGTYYAHVVDEDGSSLGYQEVTI